MTSIKNLILVTGPARSGKSEWAETLAMRSGKPVVYVATAQVDPNDLEWLSRIEQHQRRRPREWATLQVPITLAATIRSSQNSSCLLVDSLGTWVANFLDQDDETWEKTCQELLESLDSVSDAILVAEETGWGVVPAYPLGRLFRDRLGGLVRRVGAIANPVYLVTAGHVLNLSHLGTPLPK
ncbi:bifunctional adenosylcobinamide kinase/adenosylcobinamide-phosphate guanylyltransferase [Coleofasciculus sp. FACHB-1120]|uniref:bifunctional adenosylcobinamide kinase/adenosylcobinamide-phosphate guanylyltransferase n=1 Tax=Coleofasciculus sp. FACHB-1120 TaxID=2692783 RepID=UPI001686A882|nr:bifunctional adenosylcobinamide kinase/adenosylcobinamide-phosphate guanylyltransferase [Coleofasciculus sp. FACHB-1120]MBD2744597.1 bifunctional adenosylcobinamide kinase/adenosylcobinamide-phosphate guanylyltransferase [Coleofasciculus sp. FACHB-1120]